MMLTIIDNIVLFNVGFILRAGHDKNPDFIIPDIVVVKSRLTGALFVTQAMLIIVHAIPGCKDINCRESQPIHVVTKDRVGHLRPAEMHLQPAVRGHHAPADHTRRGMATVVVFTL